MRGSPSRAAGAGACAAGLRGPAARPWGTRGRRRWLRRRKALSSSSVSRRSPFALAAADRWIVRQVPPDDRYQIITEHEPHCLEHQTRTVDRVVMFLIMRSGRSPEAKKAFYRKCVEDLARDPGIAPANVLITIVENHDIDWSFRDGVAQFVP